MPPSAARRAQRLAVAGLLLGLVPAWPALAQPAPSPTSSTAGPRWGAAQPEPSATPGPVLPTVVPPSSPSPSPEEGSPSPSPSPSRTRTAPAATAATQPAQPPAGSPTAARTATAPAAPVSTAPAAPAPPLTRPPLPGGIVQPGGVPPAPPAPARVAAEPEVPSPTDDPVQAYATAALALAALLGTAGAIGLHLTKQHPLSKEHP